VDSAAVSSDAAGIFSARQHHRDGRVLGGWTVDACGHHYYLLSLPVTVSGVFVGRWINHRLHGEVFFKYLYVGLAGIGALLLVQAITGRL
jgi:uncharacterized membrane protein YfcA